MAEAGSDPQTHAGADRGGRGDPGHSLPGLQQSGHNAAETDRSHLAYKARSGYAMPNPLVAITDGYVDTIVRLSREFGMTPASRTRIQVAAAENATVDDGMDF